MKQQPSRYVGPAHRRGEEGVYLVLFAGAIFALIVIVGAAIDLGNLTVQKFRVQRAVDAAALTGANYIAIRGKDLVEDMSYKMVERNLDQMGIEYDPADINVVLSPDLTKIDVDAVGVADLYFLGMVPGFNHAWNVPAVASAERRNVAVSLVLDNSGSMGAYTPCSSGRCQKIAALRSAAAAFIDLFDEGRDYLAITTFSTGVSTIYPAGGMQKTVPLNKTDAKLAVSRLGAYGSTFLAGSIVQGYEELKVMDGEPYRKVMVIISDGAPTQTWPEDQRETLACNDGMRRNTPEWYEGLMIETLRIADSIRADSDVTFYAIGLGEVAAGATPDDPYSNSRDSSGVKPNFLRRLVNDRDAARRVQDSDHDPAFPDDCDIPDYDQAPGPRGTYLETPDAGELEELLVQIGRSIKTRLIR